MPYAYIAGHRLYYARRRSRGEATVATVLIHGAAGSHLDWPAGLRHMTHADAYALDLPGHGRSPAAGITTIDGYADLICAFLRTLQLQRAVIIGHSMGGAIAQAVGMRAEPGVIGLVLIGTGARLRVHPQLLRQLREDFQGAVSTLADAYWGTTPPHELVALTNERLLESDPHVAYRDFVACDNFDLMDQLDRIRLPVLVVAGSRDRMTPEKYGRYLVEHLPNAELKVISDAGHLMAVERPVEVSAAVSTFISELGATGGGMMKQVSDDG